MGLAGPLNLSPAQLQRPCYCCAPVAADTASCTLHPDTPSNLCSATQFSPQMLPLQIVESGDDKKELYQKFGEGSGGPDVSLRTPDTAAPTVGSSLDASNLTFLEGADDEIHLLALELAARKVQGRSEGPPEALLRVLRWSLSNVLNKFMHVNKVR